MAEPLRRTHAACHAALDALDVAHAHAQPLVTAHSSPLRNDFLSILTLIYAATTRLSLALKPAAPTYSASLAPLKDISDNVAALSHCARLFSPVHGATLAREITAAARDVIISVNALLQTFIDLKPGDDYLVRTGAVHEIIDHTRSTLSCDNAAAVHKVLAQNHASLDDGFHEVDDMITAQDSTDDWEEDDGWSELGVDSNARMTSQELERTKKAHAILRISTLLHKRIIKDVLGSQLDLTSRLDLFPPLSSMLVVASDDLVSTLYTPQTPSETSTELAAFVTVIDSLRSTILEILQEPSLADQMQAMSLQPSATHPMKWFQTCFTQIQKAVDNLRSTLNTHE